MWDGGVVVAFVFFFFFFEMTSKIAKSMKNLGSEGNFPIACAAS